MATVRRYQNNFTSGVLSPSVRARVDLQKYASGCKRIINGVVHAHGGISNRPGTAFADELPGPGLLFPFVYSVEQTYVLAFYDPAPSNSSPHFAALRVYKEGAPVLTPASVIASAVTPYRPGDLARLNFAQSADTLFITHPSYPPQRLVRRDHHIWEFSAIDFYPEISAPTGLQAVPASFIVEDAISPGQNAVSSVAKYKVSAVNARAVESVPSAVASANVYTPWTSGAKVTLTWTPVTGAARYEVYKNTRGYYAWLGSAEGATFTDNNIEGDPGTGPKENRDPFNPPAIPASVSISDGTAGPDVLQVRVSSLNSAGAESVASVAVEDTKTKATAQVTFTKRTGAVAYMIYFRYVGEDTWSVFRVQASSSGATMTVGLASATPEDGRPLDAPNSYPGVVGIYQQRLVFCRSNLEPQTIWMSEPGAFNSMAVATPLRDDSAITVTLDSRQMNEIRHIVPLRDVILFTSGAEFQMSAGRNADAVTPTAISFQLQSYWGANELPPIVSGSNIVFIENSGRVVRDLQYRLDSDGYAGDDVSILAEHLLDSQIVDWAFQQAPWSTVWICLENGRLLTFTYMREQEIWAWSEHESSGGKFLSVSVVREGPEDNAYFIVQRGGRYFVEYQRRRRYGDDLGLSFFVDCGLSYDDPAHPISHVTGLDHLAGQAVVALADGSVIRGKTVAPDGSIDLASPAGRIAVGLPYTTMVETLDPEIKAEDGDTLGRRKTVSSATFMIRETRGLSAGPSEDAQVPVKFPHPEMWGQAPGLFSGMVDVVLPGSHRQEASIVFRQEDPLPMTVLSVMTTVSVG